MPQSISHTTTIVNPWAPVSNSGGKTPPLRLTKRRPTSPRRQEVRSPSPARAINGQSDGVSNSDGFVPQRPPRNDPPASLYDPNDPAFSSDPYHHPDHDALSSNLGTGKGATEPGSPISRYSSQSDAEPPPSYDDCVPASNQNDYLRRPEDEATASPVANNFGEEVRGASHIRERAQDSYSPTTSPYSGTQHIPTSQQTQDDSTNQEQLLAYLSDERGEPDSAVPRGIPVSLRPHRGVPVTTQPPAEAQRHERPVPENTGLLRSTTMPPSASRSVSEPLTRTNTERPQMPRRGNTTTNASTPHRGPADLDRIDELDETLGIPLHHRGPYDMRGKVDTPPPRVRPVDRQPQAQPAPKQHVLVATTPLNAPPPPIPFKLDLKPGEFLTRVPPSRSQTTPPERVVPAATAAYPTVTTEQPMHPPPRPGAQNRADHAVGYQGARRNEWSPEQLYETHAVPAMPRDLQRGPYYPDARSNSTPPSVGTSRTDLRPNIPPNPQRILEEHRSTNQRHISFQQVQPQQNSPLSRSISQPVHSSSASAYSSSSRATRPPPSAANRHLPKQIVLPAPLQQKNQNTTYTLPSELMRGGNQSGTSSRPVPGAQPAAAVIPIHDPKKSNFLKKRMSIGTSRHQGHNHLAPERSSSSKGFFSFGLGKSSSSEPESSLSKANRKLSKRGKI